MGSYDPMLSAFTPTKYLGTINSSSCVTGYDQAAFVFGTSSELFNQFNVSVGNFRCHLFRLVAHLQSSPAFRKQHWQDRRSGLSFKL
jgi:hypothetical protein